MDLNIPDNLDKLGRAFASNGRKLYITGGYVRNALLSYGAAADIDLASDAPAAEIKKFLKGFSVVPVSEELGTCVIAARRGGGRYEYTPFRSEIYPKDSGAHRPTAVKFAADINEDAARRDFTCNALYYSITEKKLLDPLGGAKDIEKKILRAVISPDAVFSRDGLRLLRMARQSAELGFTIERGTAAAAARSSSRLADISAERKAAELEKMLNADLKYGVPDAHYRALAELGRTGAWPFVIPELQDCAGVPQPPAYHAYDVYEHILQTVRFAPPSVRLAALFHDIGKPAALGRDGNTYRHPDAGADIARTRLGSAGLKFPNAKIRETVRLVQNHMYDSQGVTRAGKLRLFIADNFDIMEKLIALKKADALATGKISSAPKIRMESVYREMLADGVPVSVGDLKINGAEVAEICSVAEKRNIGRILRSLRREAVLNPTLNTRARLTKIARKIAEGL